MKSERYEAASLIVLLVQMFTVGAAAAFFVDENLAALWPTAAAGLALWIAGMVIGRRARRTPKVPSEGAR